MIFRSKGIEPDKDCLLVDNIIDVDIEPMAKEFLENMPNAQRGKVISGTFGTFNIKDFERITERLKDV